MGVRGGDQMIPWHRLAHETLRIREKGSEQKGGGGGGGDTGDGLQYGPVAL